MEDSLASTGNTYLAKIMTNYRPAKCYTYIDSNGVNHEDSTLHGFTSA